MDDDRKPDCGDEEDRRIEWTAPVLDRLSMRATGTTNTNFTNSDAVNSYS